MLFLLSLVSAALSVKLPLSVGGGPGPAPQWASGFVGHDGVLVASAGTFQLNTTIIGTGHYCWSDSVGTSGYNFATVLATIQDTGQAVPPPGFAVANTGFGDNCNPFGYAIYTYDLKGRPANMSFTVYVSVNN